MYICNSCPRNCGIDRDKTSGICGVGKEYKVARAGLHFWEEPCISGTNGSGTVFFSGCSLKCVYCQNYEISSRLFGKEISEERLMQIFDELISQGANNINLVNPTHYAPMLAKTLRKYHSSVPVVYNTGGYDSVESLKMLDGLVDIYLTDIKYATSEASEKYSKAKDYFDVASKAVLEMHCQISKNEFADDIMKKGIIIRHLVLPSNVNQSLKVLNWIGKNLPHDSVLSIMSQYMPCGEASEYNEINRKLTAKEYDFVLNHAQNLGFENVFIQELDSSDSRFIPKFDLSGV